jgi:hypothetical protein
VVRDGGGDAADGVRVASRARFADGPRLRLARPRLRLAHPRLRLAHPRLRLAHPRLRLARLRLRLARPSPPSLEATRRTGFGAIPIKSVLAHCGQ